MDIGENNNNDNDKIESNVSIKNSLVFDPIFFFHWFLFSLSVPLVRKGLWVPTFLNFFL